jgi:glutamyl-tRNA synthetase
MDALAVFSAEETEKVARDFAEGKDIKPGIPINGSRAVLTGQIKGPSMFEVFAHLGKETVVRRLREAGKWFTE